MKSAAWYLLTALSAPALSASINGFVVSDYSYIVHGGAEEGHAWRGLASLGIEHQFNDDVTFYADVQLQRGRDGSELAGDIQAFSNIDEQDFSRLYEAWVEWAPSDNVRFKLGQIDANTEFAANDHAAEFINSSKGFSPTISFLPTYPLPRLALASFYKPSADQRVGLAVFADDDNHWGAPFVITQVDQHFGTNRLALGWWHKTDAELVNGDIADTSGWYATAEGDFSDTGHSWSPHGWFVQYGRDDRDEAEIYQHLGFGITWQVSSARPDDLYGIGVTRVKTSPLTELAATETIVETFYRYQINELLAIKPDLQWIYHPAAAKGVNDAWVATVRMEISF